MSAIIDFIMNIDQNLLAILDQYGLLAYAIVFGIVFAETGFVVTPFLPGDSLIFAMGAIAAKGGFNIFLSYIVLLAAAIAGDAVNYHVGHKIGRKAFRGKHLFKEEYLEQTEAFYEKHGGKTIIIARFIPIIRTFAPFVAGIGKMSYREFLTFNVVGALLWVSAFLAAGFFFGNIPVVEHNFTLVIFAIIGLSVLPGIYHFIKAKLSKTAEAND